MLEYEKLDLNNILCSMVWMKRDLKPEIYGSGFVDVAVDACQETRGTNGTVELTDLGLMDKQSSI